MYGGLFIVWNLMVRRINTSIPPILRGRVIRRGSRLALLPIEILPERPLLDGVVIPEESAFAKLGNKEIDDILE